MSILTEYVLNERAIWAEQLRLYILLKERFQNQEELDHNMIQCRFFDYKFLINKVVHFRSAIPMTTKQIDEYISANLSILSNTDIFDLSSQANRTIFFEYYAYFLSF